MGKRDIMRLEKIAEYCQGIEDAQRRFGSFENYLTDMHYRNAVCMCILQIGELASGLSEAFIEETTGRGLTIGPPPRNPPSLVTYHC